MFNKKVLAMAKAALNSAKPPAKKKDIIVDPRGQWEHPGKVTRIPSNEITMEGVPYPVYGVDDTGYGQMMYPEMDYTFPGNYVDEYPQMQRGGFKYQPTFTDSLALYNNAIAIKNFYNAHGYKNTEPKWSTIDPFKILEKSREHVKKNPSIDANNRSKKVPYNKYYKKLNGYQFNQRDVPQNPYNFEGLGALNINAPIGLYDIRIKPNTLVTYSNVPSNYDEITKKLYFARTPQEAAYWKSKLPKNPDSASVYGYDPLSIKPSKMLTVDEVKKRYKQFGPSGISEEQLIKAGIKKDKNLIKTTQPRNGKITSSNSKNNSIEDGNWMFIENVPTPQTNPKLDVISMPIRPLSSIDHNIPLEVIPSAAKPKSNNIKPPSSATQWVQHPATGTWHQIERPIQSSMLPEYNLDTGSYKKQKGGSGPACPEGYTYDAASNTCIPTGEYEYVDDPNDQRLQDYKMQDILYRYSQLPYKHKSFLDAKDILSGDFNTSWNEYMNNSIVSEEQKQLRKNDLLDWEGSKAQVWNLSPKQLNSFINSSAFTWTPQLDYTWRNNDLAPILKKYPPAGYHAREHYSSYPYASIFAYNPDIPEQSGYNHYIKPNTAFIEDKIDRARLKKIYPNLTDEEINNHLKDTRESPDYVTNYQDPTWGGPIYHINAEADQNEVYPLVNRITPEDINSEDFISDYQYLPKKGTNSYLQEAETDNITYEGEYIPTWLAPKKKYILRTALPTPVIQTPKEPVTQEKIEKDLKISNKKDVQRTMRVPVQGTETYYVKGPTGQLVPRQRPVTTYEEVPWTDERTAEPEKYNLETGTFEKKKGGSVKSKKYSRSIEATNRLFHENEMFKKQKSKKKKIYDPYAKYFQKGGTKLSPKDEAAFQKFFNTLPDNLMDDDPSYDIRGYWDSEGRPTAFNYDQPKESDGFYHAYSINANTGEYLKAPTHPTFQHAVDEDRKIGYRPITNVYGRNIAIENPALIEPEEQSFLRNMEGPVAYKVGGFHDDINKHRKLLRDWTYGQSIGMLQKQDGGEPDYIEAELTDDEIQAYRDGGYTVEDISVPSLTKAQDGMINVSPFSYHGDTAGMYRFGTKNPTFDIGYTQPLGNRAKNAIGADYVSAGLTAKLPYKNNTGVGLQGNFRTDFSNNFNRVPVNTQTEFNAGYDPNLGGYANLTASPQFMFGNVSPTVSKRYGTGLKQGEFLGSVGPFAGGSYIPGRKAQEERFSIPAGVKGNIDFGIGRKGVKAGLSGYAGADLMGGGLEQNQNVTDQLKGKFNYGVQANLKIPIKPARDFARDLLSKMKYEDKPIDYTPKIKHGGLSNGIYKKNKKY